MMGRWWFKFKFKFGVILLPPRHSDWQAAAWPQPGPGRAAAGNWPGTPDPGRAAAGNWDAETRRGPERSPGLREAQAEET
jgi:hypothetical protein